MLQILGYAILFIVVVIFFKWATKRKSKLGINLKRNYCPVCGTPQPIIRIPKTLDQALFGGSNCPKCNAKHDKYGTLIP